MVKILDDEESFSIEYGGPLPPPSGNLWIVKTVSGISTIYRLDTDGNIILELPSTMLWCIEADSENFLWVSKNNPFKKLYKLDMVGNPIEEVYYPDLPDGWIYGLSEDTNGNFWLALSIAKKICNVTKTGEVNCFDIDTSVHGLTYDPNGYLLVTLASGGIRKIDLDGNYVETIPIPGDVAYGIDIDAYGSIWIVCVYFKPVLMTKLHKLDNDGNIIKTIELPEHMWNHITGLTVESGGT